MRTKKVYIEAAKTKSFQKYTVGLEVEAENITDEQIREIQARCRKLCQEQIKIDER